MSPLIKERIAELFPVIAISIALVIFKIPHLSLPHYWDEAWPFAAAIQHLYDNGVSMMPNAIPPLVSRGHPLLFHFLAASWMKVFGAGLVAKHSFALAISIALLFSLYFLSKKVLGNKIAYAVVLLFALQQMFLVQSSMIMLEVFLALWAVVAGYAFLIRKNWLYILAGSALLLTKESGLVFIIAIVVWFVIEKLFTDYKTLFTWRSLKAILIYSSPVAVAAIFFIVQRIQLGWFFSPWHVGFMSFEPHVILEKLNAIVHILFIDSGRWFISIIAFASFVTLLIRNTRIKNQVLSINLKWLNPKVVSAFWLSGIFIVGFIIFSSLNFLSNRYLLITLPFFILITAILYSALKLSKYINFMVVAVALVFLIIPSMHSKRNMDVKMGFVDALEVHQQVKNYCTANIDRDAEIYTHFLINSALTKPYAGFLDADEKPFKNVVSNFKPSTEYCIFSNMERIKSFDRILEENNLVLMKRFEKNNAWTNIYKVIEYKRNSDGK